jgi:hypothetical protein
MVVLLPAREKAFSYQTQEINGSQFRATTERDFACNLVKKQQVTAGMCLKVIRAEIKCAVAKRAGAGSAAPAGQAGRR